MKLGRQEAVSLSFPGIQKKSFRASRLTTFMFNF
jgi:hypothetical protein